MAATASGLLTHVEQTSKLVRVRLRCRTLSGEVGGSGGEGGKQGVGTEVGEGVDDGLF